MSILVTFIDTYGEVIMPFSAPDQEHIDMNIPKGGSYVLGHPPDNSYYYMGQWVIKPDRPNILYRWDNINKQWTDPRTLADIKAQKWEELKTQRELDKVSPLTTPYGIIDADDKSQKNITDAILMLQTLSSLGTPGTIDFTMHDNSVVTMDLQKMVTVGLTLGQRTQQLQAKGTALRSQLDAATTKAEVEALTWSTN